MIKNTVAKISIKRMIQFLPLAGVVYASMIVNGQLQQQILILVVFIWAQVFFLIEVLLPV